MAQEKQSKAGGQKMPVSTQVAGRGGARAGAGRKAGSGAFGEATVPMRVPVSLADEVGSVLEAFKLGVLERKEAASKVGPLCAKGLRNKANHLVELAGSVPSGKPIDVVRVVASRPETCYAWTATRDHEEAGVKAGDTLVIDRGARAVHGSLGAFWQADGVELLSIDADRSGVRARKSGSVKAERQAASIDELGPWGVVVGIVRKLA